MIQKKRELHLSYSQAFGVALPTDKFSPRYSAGIHLFYCWEIHLLIAKFREYSEYRKRLYLIFYMSKILFFLFLIILFYLFNLCYKGAAVYGNLSPFRGQSYKK